MTTRTELLDAVAKAAEQVMLQLTFADRYPELRIALAALDAHRAEPAGEVVEVVAHVRLNDARNAYIVSGMGALNGRWQEEARGNTIATLTARVPLPTIPTIAAEVVR